MRVIFVHRLDLLMLLALLTSGCQLTDNAETINSWGATILRREGRLPQNPSPKSSVLLVNARNPEAPAYSRETHELEGTGQFIGERQPILEQPANYRETNDVTLNLVNVATSQAAKAVLGDILSVRYTVDPGIEGKITIQTPKPVTKAEVIDLFTSALRANGAAIVNNNGTYRITPIDQASVGAVVQTGSQSDGPNKLGLGLRAVQLKYVSALEMRRVLEPIVPRGSIVRTDEARNLITLSGSERDITNILDTIALFDVDVMKGMSFGFFPVTTSQPDTIVDELRNVFASDREGPMAGMVRFLPNKRLKAILVISPQRTYITRAGSWIRKLDARAEGSEKQFYTYSVQNRRAQELVDVIQAILSKEISTRTGNTGRNVSPEYRESRLQSGSGAFSSASPSSASPSQNAIGSSASPQSSIPAVLGQERSAQQPGGDITADDTRVKIVADDAKNAILIEATRTDYRRVMRVIENLDVIPNQVLIEATIAEVTLNDQLKFGVRWYLNNQNSKFTFSDLATGAVSAAFPGFSYTLTAAKLAGSLNALNSITDVNVISSPTLTAMDGRTAHLQIGDQVPITTQSASSVLTPGAPVVNSVTYKDTGVILAITPRINESGRVLLDIEQEVSTVDSTTTSGIDSPTIHQRRIKTSVVVNNGEGLALGGMIQDSKSVSHTQVPIVGDFPIVGNAFKFKDNKIVRTELIVIITPHVMRSLSEARAVTDEFRRQLTIYTPRDYHQPRSFEQSVRRTFE